jgi:ABC-type glycerol-3-phosphate transport system permease component
MTSPAIDQSVRPAAGATVARRRMPVSRIVTYVAVIVLALVFAFPFYWMLVLSLKNVTEIDNIPPTLWPTIPTPQNYVDALLEPNRYFPLYFWNTIVMVSLGVTGRLLSNTVVAYGFARIPFPGRNALFVLVLSTMMIPDSVLLIPQFLLFKQFGWLDSILPLVVPRFVGSAFFIFLLRQFYMTIPRELDEAAVIDGANHFHIFRYIMLPLSRPILITVFALSFVELWNEFFGPLIYLNSREKMVLAVALRNFILPNRPLQVHLLMAASTVTVLPVIVVFLICQRHFIRGIALTGLKG